MSRGQKLLTGAAVLWAAAGTEFGVVLLRDSLGKLPTVLASVGIIFFTPLALMLFAWLWARPQPPTSRIWISVLVSPWILAGFGLLVGSVIENQKTSSYRSYASPSPNPVRSYWARGSGPHATTPPDFFGDSVFIQQLHIRFRPKRSDVYWDSDKIKISGLVRNASTSAIVLDGFWGQYLTNSGPAVGDFNCEAAGYAVGACGFTRTELLPGYAADFSTEVSPGPSVARRDTLTFFVRFTLRQPL